MYMGKKHLTFYKTLYNIHYILFALFFMENLSWDCTDVWELNYIKFCKDLKSILISAKSSQEVITWINDVFVKLRRLVNNYSQVKFHLNLLNLIKFDFKICDDREFQKKIFDDICKILNSFNDSFFIWNFHNSISKTSLKNFKNMTLWEQLYNVEYWKKWKFNYDCKWWNCTKYTLIFYKFFDMLRNAWLDLKISIFRFKNINDNFVWVKILRHSWLIINFQWVNYLVDYGGINDVLFWTVIQSIDSLKSVIETLFRWDFAEFDKLKVENLEKYSSRENKNCLFILFNNVEDFLVDVENFPWPKRVSLIDYTLRWEPTKLSFEFNDKWVCVEFDENKVSYILKQGAILDKDPSKFFESFADNIDYVINFYWERRKFQQRSKSDLLKLFNIIKDKIDLWYVISWYNCCNSGVGV